MHLSAKPELSHITPPTSPLATYNGFLTVPCPLRASPIHLFSRLDAGVAARFTAQHTLQYILQRIFFIPCTLIDLPFPRCKSRPELSADNNHAPHFHYGSSALHLLAPNLPRGQKHGTEMFAEIGCCAAQINVFSLRWSHPYDPACNSSLGQRRMGSMDGLQILETSDGGL